MQELKDKISNSFFKDIVFKEEEHSYVVKSATLKISVSGLIKKYKYPVDWEKVIANLSASSGKSQKEIKEEWKEKATIGCDIGNKAHKFGELYPFDRTIKPITAFDRAIAKFWDDLPKHVVPLLLEVKMYHKKYMFAGTADILLYNTLTGKIIICDYKTNKDLFKNFNQQKMTGPFSHLLCCNYNHYSLQLSYYQILLEQIPGIEVSGRKLIWLKPDGTYLLYDLEDYTDILNKELKNKGI